MEAGGTPPGGAAPPPEGGAAPSEEELRARLEEEMRKVRVQDLLLQSVASLVNLTARRIVKEDERDLEQARIGIEAVRALAELLEPEPRKQVSEALSELQMRYAQASGSPAPSGAAAAEGAPAEGESGRGEAPPPRPPPSEPRPSAKPPSKLWTPHQRD